MSVTKRVLGGGSREEADPKTNLKAPTGPIGFLSEQGHSDVSLYPHVLDVPYESDSEGDGRLLTF